MPETEALNTGLVLNSLGSRGSFWHIDIGHAAQTNLYTLRLRYPLLKWIGSTRFISHKQKTGAERQWKNTCRLSGDRLYDVFSLVC